MATAYFLAQQQQHPSQQLAAAHMPLPPTHLAAAAAPHVASAARPRRTARLVTPNPAPRQFRGVKSMRELAEPPSVAAFRARFEAGRSFDLDDDLEFCPSLLTDDDVGVLMSLWHACRLTTTDPNALLVWLRAVVSRQRVA